MPQPIPGPLVYEEGRSSRDAREFFANMPLDIGQVNPDYIQIFDDFTYLSGKAINATDMYDVVKDASAAVAQADEHGGVVVITSATTTDDDGGLVQATGQYVKLQSNKKLWFEARVKASDADQHDMFVGLAKQAATNPEAVVAASLARIGFEIVDGSANIMAATCDATTISRTDTGADQADAAYNILGFYYNGSTVDFYVDRVKRLSGIVPGVVVGTDLLSLAFFNLSGNNTGTHTATMDYWMLVAER